MSERSAPTPAPPPIPSTSTGEGEAEGEGEGEVFYAAYGSNLSAERFGYYIAGGTAPGAQRALRGARDRRPPGSWRALRVPGSLYFSGHARTWGGAPAFFEPDEHTGGEAMALVRAWRLGWGQFEDVMAQENGRATRTLDVHSAALVEGFSMLTGPGRYDRLVCLGTLEDIPVLTFTAPGPPDPERLAPPAVAYLDHIITGLREAFDLDDRAIADYVGSAPGSTPDLVRLALTTQPP
jgi:hypothetical protein